MLSPLSPFLYVRRNPGKTLPIGFVIVLAVMLVASIVTIIRSIDLTIFTLYGYNRYIAGVTPRNALEIAPDELEKIKNLPELGKFYEVHSYQTMVKTIFGKMVFPIFGLEPEARAEIMQRCGIRVSQGRMVEEGKPEAVVSEEIARNLGLKVGDILLKPESQDSYAPIPVRLVGTLQGKVWLGMTSKSLVDTESPFNFVAALVVAPTDDLSLQKRLDDALEASVNRKYARVWRFEGLVKETQAALSNLYLIMHIVIAIIVFAISFVSGLLFNIYYNQRLPEIALLLAIGHSRKVLLRRAILETLLLCLFGWSVGSLATMALLSGIREVFITPRGLLLNPFDLQAYLFTLPLPVVILLFALTTIGTRLARLDPVSIIERRA